MSSKSYGSRNCSIAEIQAHRERNDSRGVAALARERTRYGGVAVAKKKRAAKKKSAKKTAKKKGRKKAAKKKSKKAKKKTKKAM